MRLITLAAVAALTILFAPPAQADMADDCEQDYDPDLKVGACTAAIRSGQWSGKDLSWAYNNRGYAYSELGEHRRAIQDLDQAIRLDPEDALAYNNRGVAYLELGERRRAIQDLDQALRLDPEYAIAYNNRGIVYRALGEHRRAIQDYDQAIRLDPQLALAYNNRAIAYNKLGKHRRAIQDYDQAIRLDPKYAYAYNNRAWTLYRMGRNAEALADVNHALALVQDENTIDTRAHVLAALGRMRDAVAAFEQAIEVGGVDVVRRYQEALKKHGYYRGAIDGAYGPNTRAALNACINAGCRLLVGIEAMATGPAPSIPSEPIIVNQRESLTGEAVRFCYDDAYVRAVIDAGDLLSGSIGDPVSDDEARRYRARLREVDDPDACETPSDRHVTAFLDPDGTSGVPPVIEGKTILETADPAGPNRNCTDPASNGRCRLSIVPHNAFLAYVYSPRLSPQHGGSVVLVYVFTARQIYDPATGRLYGQKMR